LDLFKDNYRKISNRYNQQYETQIQKSFEVVTALEAKIIEHENGVKKKKSKKSNTNLDCDEAFIILNSKLDNALKDLMDRETELSLVKKERDELISENMVDTSIN